MDVSDIFYFFCSGEGKGDPEAPGEGGGRFLLKSQEGGGLQDGRGRGCLEGVCSKLGNFGGGG